MPPRIAAVAVADFGRLGGDIERFACLFAGHHFVGLPLELAHRIELAALVHFAAELVETREQVAAVIEPLHGERVGDGQVAHLEVGGVGITFGLKRIVLRAQVVAADIAGTDADAARIRNSDMGRHSLLPGAQDFCGDGAEEGELARVVHAADPRAAAGQHPVAAGEVVAGVMMERADDGKLVGNLRLQREKFRHLHPRHVRFDRRPQPAIFRRSFRLHVIHIHVPGPAIEPQQDHGRIFFGHTGSRGSRLHLQELGQTHRGHSRHAQLQKAAARLAVAIFRTDFSGINAKHGGTPGDGASKARARCILGNASIIAYRYCSRS